MTIGIAIPTYIKHLNKIENLLDSIQLSTTKPDVVSISCSGCDKQDFNFDKYDFDILIKYTKDNKNAASNRNTAADMLDTDIISFMDSDDLMHTQRVEFLLKSFEKYKCDAILHNYKFTNSVDFEFIINRYESTDYLHEYVNTTGLVFPTNNLNHLPYANGHISVLKGIFDIYRYNDNISMLYKEDSEYSNRLVKNGIKISYILNPLSLYIK